jgi:hypothetical protein
MASNRGNQGGSSKQGGNQGGGNRDSSSDRGFAGMSDEEQREIARKGGESSSRSQSRDEQGQFDVKGQPGGGNRGGSSSGSGGSGSSSKRGGGGGSNR